MNIHHLLKPQQVHTTRKDVPYTLGGASSERRTRDLTLATYVHGSARCVLGAVAMVVGVAMLSAPAWAQTADDLAKQYKMETMEQALQTKERYDLYGLHFATDQSTIPADAKPLLDDIAT